MRESAVQLNLEAAEPGLVQIPSPGANAGEWLIYNDRFAWAARHEKSHHDQYHHWWTTGTPPRVWNRDTTDKDGDFVPDELEPEMSGEAGGPYDRTKWDTYEDDRHLSDDERHAAKTAQEWIEDQQRRSFKADWAKPGKNWP